VFSKLNNYKIFSTEIRDETLCDERAYKKPQLRLMAILLIHEIEGFDI
jgi:hypothetical protein